MTFRRRSLPVFLLGLLAAGAAGSEPGIQAALVRAARSFE
jgi:hypothetical protein